MQRGVCAELILASKLVQRSLFAGRRLFNTENAGKAAAMKTDLIAKRLCLGPENGCPSLSRELMVSLLESERVHPIRDYTHFVRRFSHYDREVYGLFSPELGENTPISILYVGLVDLPKDLHAADVYPNSIHDLLETALPDKPVSANMAVFYSVSALKVPIRVSNPGRSLIFAAVDNLKQRHPKIKRFVTLSPVPGFRDWLTENAFVMDPAVFSAAQAIQTADDVVRVAPHVKHGLLAACLYYLNTAIADSVYRFHCGNGARLANLNWGANVYPYGISRSFGIMANYAYPV